MTDRLGLPDPLEALARLSERHRKGSRDGLARLAALTARLDETMQTGWQPRGRPQPPSPDYGPSRTSPSEGPANDAPLPAIHVTRNTHGGRFGRSIHAIIAESYRGR